MGGGGGGGDSSADKSKEGEKHKQERKVCEASKNCLVFRITLTKMWN